MAREYTRTERADRPIGCGTDRMADGGGTGPDVVPRGGTEEPVTALPRGVGCAGTYRADASITTSS